jgi:hypothetical protein
MTEEKRKIVEELAERFSVEQALRSARHQPRDKRHREQAAGRD